MALSQDMSKRATWELQNIVKALGRWDIFNTPEERERLRAARAELIRRAASKRTEESERV